MTNTTESWNRFKRYTLTNDKINLSLDISKVAFQDEDFDLLKEKAVKALNFMQTIEEGDVANPDENRMVGHYWLRNSELAPSPDLKSVIDGALKQIKDFAKKFIRVILKVFKESLKTSSSLALVAQHWDRNSFPRL